MAQTPAQYEAAIDAARDKFVQVLREKPELVESTNWRKLSVVFGGGANRPTQTQIRTAFAEAVKIVRKEFLKYCLT